MKKRVFNLLILVVALATTFSTFSQRKVETTHLIVKSAKNAAVLGTDETGRVVEKELDLDLSNLVTKDSISDYIPQIVAGTNITIDNADPKNPVINATSDGVSSIVAGTNIAIDNTDPANPIINSTGGSTGLEAITENGNTGWRLIGRDVANYGNIGNEAVDFSYSTMAINNHGATGNSSFATGFVTTASGNSSFATGTGTIASGNTSHSEGSSTRASGDSSHAEGDNANASGRASHAEGSSTRASGDSSHAEGYSTYASGNYSHAEGHYTEAIGTASHAGGRTNTARSLAEVAIGSFGTDYTVSNATLSRNQFFPTDRIFNIGNGVDMANKSDALTILKNGKISAPSFDMAEITDAKDLVTLEKLQSELSSAGGVSSIVAGTNVAIDNTDPSNPIINVNGGINSTDLTYVPAANQGMVESSNGTDAIIPVADATNAGLMRAGFEAITTETVTATMIAHQDNVINGSGSFALNDPNIKVDYTKTGRLKRMTFNVGVSYTSIEPTDLGDWIVKIPTTIHGSAGEGMKLPLLPAYSEPDTFDAAFNKEERFSCKGYFRTNTGEIILKIKLNPNAVDAGGSSGVSSFNFNLVYRTDS